MEKKFGVFAIEADSSIRSLNRIFRTEEEADDWLSKYNNKSEFRYFAGFLILPVRVKIEVR